MHWTIATAVAGTSYLAIGWLSMWLSIPPGLASPLYLPAGVALAFALVYGARILPAVGVAAFAVNVLITVERGLPSHSWWVAACIGLGAAAQAHAGMLLVRRWVKQPLVLSEPRDIALFFGLGGAVACTVSATVATATLMAAQVLAPGGALLMWATWWMGDTLGVLVAAPVALTLIGLPRADWAPRRLTVGVSLLVASGLLAAGIVLAVHDGTDQSEQLFLHDAALAEAELAVALKGPLQALTTLHGVYSALPEPSIAAHRQAAAAPLQEVSAPQSMGWAERVPPEGIPAFEARAQQEGLPSVRVFSASGDTEVRAVRVDEQVVALRFLASGAEAARPPLMRPGLNLLSLPGARPAIEEAVRSGKAVIGWLPAADAPPTLPGAALVFRAVYAGEPLSDAQRLESFRGVVFVLVRIEGLLQSLKPHLSTALGLCVDLPAAAAGPAAAACPQPKAHDLHAVRTIAWANLDLRLHARADRLGVPETGRFAARALAVVGLLSVAMLGALLLTVTGRAHRIQAAVTERTAELLQQIKEREATEANLRESETRLSNIFNNLPLGVVYTNVEGQLKQVNTRFCELLGYEAGELLAMNALDFTHAEDAVQDDELVSQLVSGRIPVFSRQKRLLRKNGETVWVQSTVSLLRDLEGRPRRIVAAVEDITEHLRLGEAESAREAAEAANQAKSVFLSRMSHELRTPLNAMLGFAQLMELDTRHRLHDSQRAWVAQIQKAGWHLLDMINDVMDLSRIESGNLRLQEQTLDLFELLAGTLPLIEADARRRGLTITHDIRPDAGLVSGDATRVKQILTNLLTNAVKYNNDGGRIHIASRQRSGMVDVSVTDTGMGLSPEQMAELFQPFNRLGRDRSNIEGTGIGLVISQRLAEWMGGSLRAHSTLGQGSTFTMSLVRVESRDTVRSDLDEPEASLDTYHRRRVHYVEDNETNVEVMRGILAQRSQIELSVSTTGLDGLAAIRTLRPDVVLLDMHLPDISGMELLRHLQSDAGTAAIPVIVVSADALNAQTEEALALGAQHYLTKPVNVGELLGLLDNILIATDTVFG